MLATTALGVVSAHAIDGTWVGGNGVFPDEWVEPTNWTSDPVVPNGTATFTNTGPATVANNNGIVLVGTIQFTSTPNAQAYTVNIDNPFVLNGTGIVNNSTNTQTFNVSTGNSLTFQNGSTASGGTGAVAITLVGSAALNFNNTSSAGSASISAAALGGTITFNDMSTASSSVIHLADTMLTFNNSSTAGSATIDMPDNMHTGTINFNNTSTAGSSNITVVGSLGIGGSLNFLNASTAGSATITNNPGLGAGGLTIFGTPGGTDTSNAGTAHITNNNMGATQFSANTSALNATITNNSGGSTFFGDQSTAAGATILNNNGGTTTFGLILVGTDTATAGTANITNAAGGTTGFTAATTAGNATIANNTGGFLQFGDSGIGSSTASAGNAAITNNGTTSFNALTTAGNSTFTTHNGGNVFFFDSSTGGSAQFITNAGGTFDMSGLTAAGMTAGSIAGAGSYVLGGKNLSVGSNNLSTGVSGVISGVGGSLTKVGTGTLTLSNTNTYTGATTVNAGALEVDGSIAASSLTTVNTGSLLAGSGTVGNTSIAGGTLLPGSTSGGIFGPLTVQGNLSFTAASTYQVEVSPANAARTNVTGTAMLGGAMVDAVFMPGSYVARQYTIVNSTGLLSGTFNPTVMSNMTDIQSTLSYDNHDAYLNIQINFTPPSGNLNVNQQNVANALINFFNSTGGIPVAFASLSPAGLTQISGELATASQQTTFDAMNLFMGVMTDPFIAGRGNPISSPGDAASGYADEASAYASDGRTRSNSARDAYAAIYTKAPPAADPFAQRWSVWAAGYGGSQNTDGNAALGSNTATSGVYGTAVGADYRFSPSTLAGFALAGGGTNFSLANGLGSGRSDLFQAGAYIRHNAGPSYITAALAYGWQDITTNRTVTVAGMDRLQAQFNANAFSGRVEGGYRFMTPLMGITPYAAAQFTTFDLPAYAESILSGANTFALAYNAKSVTDTRSEIGLRSDKPFAMQDGIFTLRGRVAWAHDFDIDRNIAATFQTLPGASFVVNGAAQAHDAALTSASAEMKWLNGFSVAATFEGGFSSVTSSYAGKGVIRYTW